ncbi:hypothetical protein JT358_13345 [Micrococcales bacterium 31B]|nr:hypothetical protein [Micrococcales bacterium 31B]
MRRSNLLSWRAAAVVGVVAVLAGCSQPEPLVREGGYAGSGPVETPLQMPTTAIGEGEIVSGSASGGAVTSGDASTATEPARTIPVVEPEPGSTWTPPVESADDLKLFESAKQLGYTMEYRDPATFPAKATGLTPPTMDADGFTQTEAGAVLVTNYFFHALNYYVNTGDANAVDVATTAGCVNCKAIGEQVSSTYSAGGYALTQEISIQQLKIVDKYDGGILLEGLATYQPISTYVPSKSIHVQGPDLSGKWQIYVVWIDKEHYVVDSIAPIK